MNLEERARLSYYEKLTALNDKHGIWLVKHRENNRIYVLKELDIYTVAIYHFLKEKRSVYFPQIIDYMEDNGRLILIEEYINGQTLFDIVHENGPLDIKRAIWVMQNICDALSVIHKADPPIINRDIKPSNVMLTDDGMVKIVDFNVARIYEKGRKDDTMFLGSEQYAAPEQYGYRQSDARTDIYAAGVMFNFLLTGQLPKDRNADGPAWDIITKCISLEPDMRYQSAEELKHALELQRILELQHATGNMSGNYCGKFNNMQYNSYYIKNVPNDIKYTDNLKCTDNIKYSDNLKCADNIKYSDNIKPPGFRSGRTANKFVAVPGYLFVLYGVITIKGEPYDMWYKTFINNVCIKLVFLSWMAFIIMFACNYLDIRKYFPLMNKSQSGVSFIAGMGYCFIALFIIALRYAVFCTVFGITR